MLFGHANNASIAANLKKAQEEERDRGGCTLINHQSNEKYISFSLSYHEHAEIRKVSCHAEHSGLEVLLMACQVNKGDDLWGFLTDLGPV